MNDRSFSIFDVTASALEAQLTRVSVATKNIANASVTSTPEGGPYRRQVVSFETVLRDTELPDGGVRVSSVTDDPSPFTEVQDPGHPDAVDGIVRYPNVSVFQEMVDLVDAGRMYEANVSVVRTYRDMMRQTLEITR